MDPKAFARFWSKVQISQPHECWPYTGGTDQDGYGIFHQPGHGSMRANRFAFTCANGSDATPMALHRCHNRACCNPLHLYEGTALDNAADCKASGNYTTIYVRGERHRNAKLTNAQVAEALSMVAMGHTKRAVARHYGVSPSLISQYAKKGSRQ